MSKKTVVELVKDDDNSLPTCLAQHFETDSMALNSSYHLPSQPDIYDNFPPPMSGDIEYDYDDNYEDMYGPDIFEEQEMFNLSPRYYSDEDGDYEEDWQYNPSALQLIGLDDGVEVPASSDGQSPGHDTVYTFSKTLSVDSEDSDYQRPSLETTVGNMGNTKSRLNSPSLIANELSGAVETNPDVHDAPLVEIQNYSIPLEHENEVLKDISAIIEVPGEPIDSGEDVDAGVKKSCVTDAVEVEEEIAWEVNEIIVPYVIDNKPFKAHVPAVSHSIKKRNCKVYCEGCQKEFSAYVSELSVLRFSPEYYEHCIKDCIEYQEKGLIRHCNECKLSFLNSGSLASHFCENKIRLPKPKRPKWMRPNVYNDSTYTNEWNATVNCKGCGEAFRARKLPCGRVCNEFKYFVHCAEECVKCIEIFTECSQCGYKFFTQHHCKM